MTFQEYTSAMCPVCHHIGCDPRCPEYDGPLDDDDDDLDDDDDD